MKTRIKKAGGTYNDDENVIWQGEMALVDNVGMRVLDERDLEGKVVAYYVSQVAVSFNNSEMWQTLFVVPVDPKRS